MPKPSNSTDKALQTSVDPDSNEAYHLTKEVGAAATPRWLFTLPRIMLPLLIATVTAFAIFTIQRERQTETQALADGALWAEQNFRTNLASFSEVLSTLGQEFAVRDYNDAQFKVRARQSLRNTPAMLAVSWFWLDGTPQGNYAFIADPSHTQRLNSDLMKANLKRANLAGRATYSETYGGGDQDLKFDIAIPIAAGQEFSGFVVGTVSINNMMQSLVPGWFSEKYHLDVVDQQGAIVVSNTALPLPNGTPRYSVPFDPPGNGLSLQAASYSKGGTNTLLYLMVIAMACMAALITWSVSQLRQHVRERLRAERQLKESLAFQNAMEESLTTGMRARDLVGKIIYVNTGFCKMTGFSRDELVGTTPPHPYWAPELTDESFAAFKRVMAGDLEKNGVELMFQRKTGERFMAWVYEAPLVDAEGQHFGWMGSVVDITERKRAEETARVQQEQLQHTARLVTVGEMASSLAHELNQPLAVINSYATGGINRLKSRQEPSDLLPAFERIAEQANRAGKIINWVHEFVKRRTPEHTECDVNSIISRALSMLTTNARRLDVHIIRELASSLPKAHGDRVMLEQVVVNLARNAIEAMSETSPDTRVLVVKSELKDESIFISFSDRGSGISEQQLIKLFEPFHSTKPRGMGMGLNISKSIIEQHFGRLWYEPNPGGGSRFFVSLPLQSETTTEPFDFNLSKVAFKNIETPTPTTSSQPENKIS